MISYLEFHPTASRQSVFVVNRIISFNDKKMSLKGARLSSLLDKLEADVEVIKADEIEESGKDKKVEIKKKKSKKHEK